MRFVIGSVVAGCCYYSLLSLSEATGFANSLVVFLCSLCFIFGWGILAFGNKDKTKEEARQFLRDHKTLAMTVLILWPLITPIIIGHRTAKLLIPAK